MSYKDKKIEKSKCNKKRIQGFTLVELIVVITILAILGTIAFISFQNYTKNSRDGVRIADINSIKKNLELFITDKGFYPTPDNGSLITYKGGIAWIQGTVGDNVITNLGRLNKKPTDPLTGNEYTYSVTNNKVEYQIGAILEGEGVVSYNLPLLSEQANAATEKKALAMVTGTYNEKIIKVSTGSMYYILAVPSIINANLYDTDLQDIINKRELVYNNYSNIPDSYKNLGYTMTGGFDFIPSGDIEIYSGSTDSTLTEDADKITFINNLKQVYAGTILGGEAIYTDIINADTTNNSIGAIALVDTYITNNLGGLSGEKSTTITYSCTGTSPDGTTTISNATSTTGGSWYYDITPGVCTYACNTDNGYEWNGSNCVVVNTINNLSLGDIIIDSNPWEYKTGINYTSTGEIKPVEWIIVGKNHYEQDTVLLLSKDIIARYIYSNIQGGRPWYESENTIKPFLQSTFLNHLSSNFVNNIKNVSIITAGTTSTNQSIFILSLQELNAQLINSATNCGTGISYINESIRLTNSFPETIWYWTRTPHSLLTTYGSRVLNPIDGTTNGVYDNNNTVGVRPALNLKSTTKVVNIEGNKYIISNLN